MAERKEGEKEHLFQKEKTGRPGSKSHFRAPCLGILPSPFMKPPEAWSFLITRENLTTVPGAWERMKTLLNWCWGLGPQQQKADLQRP